MAHVGLRVSESSCGVSTDALRDRLSETIEYDSPPAMGIVLFMDDRGSSLRVGFDFDCVDRTLRPSGRRSGHRHRGAGAIHTPRSSGSSGRRRGTCTPRRFSESKRTEFWRLHPDQWRRELYQLRRERLGAKHESSPQPVALARRWIVLGCRRGRGLPSQLEIIRSEGRRLNRSARSEPCRRDGGTVEVGAWHAAVVGRSDPKIWLYWCSASCCTMAR